MSSMYNQPVVIFSKVISEASIFIIKKKKGISRLKKKGLIYTETSFRGMS